ncbi:MAG: 4-hydroxythreonine-4-phosphate dehydrogenase PdxA [Myxococcota bacterium]
MRIGISIGDPAGIGPEVVSRSLREGAAKGARVRVYGDLDALDRMGGVPPEVERRGFASARVEPGAPDPATAVGVIGAIRQAARDCLSGDLDALVTAPIAKEVWGRAGFDYPGHTELLAEIAGRERAVMLLAGGQLRVALATIHCPLREVPERITRAGLLETLQVLQGDLRRRFGLPAPRIAVCGLNPHAGEGGRFGDEEIHTIGPAVESARAAGIDASGPHPADSLFHRAVSGEFDVVLGMYHDQALAPLKLHAFGRAVNVTLGLPLIRTSVDHGTAFDIAGRGRADAGSMSEAIRVALEMVGHARRAERPRGPRSET